MARCCGLARACGWYDARAGLNAWGFGFEATKLLSSHWLFNGNVAVNRLLGSARNCPIVQVRDQGVVTVSFNYHW